ncbi:MAG: sulfatase-like hydrolase/transferase [Undibacterium sp.]|nr:sulfatase-like hydrolase/transferase [Opitutaceae bacterium]
MQRLEASPLFLAYGIYKPHLPWNVPRRYFDLYPLEQIQLPPSRPDDLDDVPAIAAAWARTDGESGVKMEKSDHEIVVAEGKWREAVQAYLASITFADAQLGRLLDAIDRSPERDNTIVVLWGDHDWHLGEKPHRRKFTLWEEGTRTPLIWVVPGVTPAGGAMQSAGRSDERVSDARGALRPHATAARARAEHPAAAHPSARRLARAGGLDVSE